MSERDYFAEEIEGLGATPSIPERDYFTEELIKNKPERAENILQKAIKAAAEPYFNGAMNVSGVAPVQSAYNIRDTFIDESVKNPIGNFATKMVTDPLTWMGGGTAAKQGSKGISGFIKNVRNPSKVFGEKMGALEKSNPSTKVDYSGILSKHMDDPMVKKVIDKSGVLQKYGGSSMGEGGTVIEKMKNLTLQESQNLINDIKVGLRQSLKEGTVTKSNEIGIQKMLSELTGNQNSLFKGMDKARSSYGMAKNFGKGAKNLTKKAISGAVLGAGGKLGYDVYKSFSGGK